MWTHRAALDTRYAQLKTEEEEISGRDFGQVEANEGRLARPGDGKVRGKLRLGRRVQAIVVDADRERIASKQELGRVQRQMAVFVNERVRFQKQGVVGLEQQVPGIIDGQPLQVAACDRSAASQVKNARRPGEMFSVELVDGRSIVTKVGGGVYVGADVTPDGELRQRQMIAICQRRLPAENRGTVARVEQHVALDRQAYVNETGQIRHGSPLAFCEYGPQ
jgi:hypothetical protein